MFSKILHPFYGELFLYLARDCNVPAVELQPAVDAFQGRAEPPADSWYVELLYRMMDSEKYDKQSVGFEYGQQLDLAAAGLIGQAVMTAATLGEAMRLMSRYYVLTGLNLQIRQERCGDELRLYPVLDYENLAAPVEVFIVDALISSWRKCSKLLAVHPPMPKRLSFRFSPPSYQDVYRRYSQGEVEFNCSRTVVVLDSNAMTMPTISGNAFVHQRAVSQCEAALLKLGESLSTREKVQRQLRAQADFSTICVDSVANSLHISTRTLIRQLQAEDCRFQELIDAHRFETATRLLLAQSWALEKIAEHLGYSDASNFRRAFKKWSGMTPREYRNSIV